ncbi:CoxG family protein [Polymorphobacter sp.]|uniref:CoxG family protein n=1 Tax=Polymorphobacter sp. TaxID=1909290 RepID=UPI003F72DA1B
MNLSGSVDIAAPRHSVWAALNDPDTLARCIEGVETLTRTAAEDGERLEGKMNAKVGPVRATFSGFVRLTDVVEGTSYRLVGEGKGGVAGFAKGEADVRLEDAGAGTTLSYDVRSSVGGKLAQLGARLIEGTAKGYAESFFARLKAELETPPELTVAPELPSVPVAAQAPEAVSASPAPTPTPPATGKGLSPTVWASLLILLVLAFLFWQWG